MKIQLWVVSTCDPDTAQPCVPDVFTSPQEAEAFVECEMQQHWFYLKGDEPYPSDWREAQDLIEDTTFGRYQITTHSVSPGKLVMILEGGVVQNILTDKKTLSGQSVHFIDYDTDGGDACNLVEIPQDNGKTASAYYGSVDVDFAESWLTQALAACE